ncbi:MAG: phosphoribosylaminoimidazolecarboxamide formyltransferase, partial [Bacteroidales bacterium]|nr:phosphoribosylaminoimidazolecarboxamide formyltransferase [Bacteroidales bacterium]
GDKADNWYLKQHQKIRNLKFSKRFKRPDVDNIIDEYINNSEVLLKDQRWGEYFNAKPEIFSEKERKDWLMGLNNVAMASDGFFPFKDNIERASHTGVKYIVQTGGSIRDQEVIEKCNSLNIAMAITGIRLFHH